MLFIFQIFFLQISLKLGLSHFELADSALSTLEQWNRRLSSVVMEKLLCQVLPCLDDFLQSNLNSNGEITAIVDVDV